MTQRSPLETFADAIKDLGGPSAAAEKLKRKQSTISGYLKDGNVPADVCMRIEIETQGRYQAEQLRPDLADDFRAFRTMRGPDRRHSDAARRSVAAARRKAA